MCKPDTQNSLQNPIGISNSKSILWDLTVPQLYEKASLRNEAKIASSGALCADTGVHTGRSPKDKYIVCDETTKDKVWWENSNKMKVEQFDSLLVDFETYANGREIFGQNLFASADPRHRISVQIHTEYAWHALFIRNLLIRPDAESNAKMSPDLTIVCLPGFKANPEKHGCRSETVIALNFSKNIILIGGTAYAGEMKKSVFSFLNFTLPSKGIMPMHCSANIGDNEDTAIFFGLSGTGKTTLSTDSKRMLIGDDEHGWGPEGIFNFEGGCYAKAINLSKDAEPEIYKAANQYGTVLENVVLSESGAPDFNDGSKTENTRCAYPIDHLKNIRENGQGTDPDNIIMLCADAFGVLPPIAKLKAEQVLFFFLSGYTAKLAGTERGVTEPEATFSACFGAPFMPCHPSVYGSLLKKFVESHKTDCWLMNTGWTGGTYGVGERMPLHVTRTLLDSVLNGTFKENEFQTEPHFGLSIPTSISGIDDKILNPSMAWSDPNSYDQQAAKLVELFNENFKQFESQDCKNPLISNPEVHLAAA